VRFNLLARRIALAPTLALALALTVAACSSSSSTSASTSASSTSATNAPATPVPASSPASSAAPSSPGTGSSSAAVAQITANWEAFFNGKTSAAKKIQLLENGSKFASIINAQAGSSIATGAGAKVTAVVVNSATSATVSYGITLNGTTALPNQTGTAVYQDGMWKVGDVSFCQLLKLENAGSTPSVCSSAG
jgi:hypothetical protein